MLLNNTAPFNPQTPPPSPSLSWSKEAIIALVALLFMVLVPCLGFAYRNCRLREVWRITVGLFSSDGVYAAQNHISFGIDPFITPEELSQAERDGWLELSIVREHDSHGIQDENGRAHEWNYIGNIV